MQLWGRWTSCLSPVTPGRTLQDRCKPSPGAPLVDPCALTAVVCPLPAALTWKMGCCAGEAPWTLRLGLAWAASTRPLPRTANGASPSSTARTATMKCHRRPCLGTPLRAATCESAAGLMTDTSNALPLPFISPSSSPSKGHWNKVPSLSRNLPGRKFPLAWVGDRSGCPETLGRETASDKYFALSFLVAKMKREIQSFSF